MNKSEIIKVCKEYLQKTHNFPECKPEIVLAELTNMYKLLEEKNLTQEMTLKQFTASAYTIYNRFRMLWMVEQFRRF